ncbi:hypothetical protein SBA4_3880005 [Candidatus Sulfopaludibacter sp. SbA4]|nr:hypothetical protein SBA4_3880005 [Candidatus Sulfopaludibacter sp. SbA4]
MAHAFVPTTSNWPLTSDFSACYADKTLIVVALVLSLAVWSFRNARGGRKILQGDLLWYRGVLTQTTARSAGPRD